MVHTAFSYLDQNRENMVETLRRFVEVPSCGREPEDVRKAAEWFRALLEQEGFLCQRAKLFTAAVLRLDEFRP